MIKDYITLQKKVYEREIVEANDIIDLEQGEIVGHLHNKIAEATMDILVKTMDHSKNHVSCPTLMDSDCCRNKQTQQESCTGCEYLADKGRETADKALKNILVELVEIEGAERVVLFDPAEAE